MKQPRLKHQLALRLGVAFVAVVFALVVGEVGLRAFRIAPETKIIALENNDCVYERSDNATLGFELKSGYRSESPDYIKSYESTNSHGLRDSERVVSKIGSVSAGASTNERARILLLGDSVVEGYGLPFENTIARQMEKLFQQSGEPQEVLNFGTSAYCTLAEIELLEVKGLQFLPSKVVLLFVENDFDNFNREAFPLPGTRRPKSAEWLFRNSHLFRLAFSELDLFQFHADVDPVAWNKEAIGENNVSKGLTRFRHLADQHGFEPLIAVWPRFTDDQIVDPHPIPDHDQLIVEALAAQNQLPIFRLSKHFQSELRKHPGVSPRLLFSQGDQLHPSKFGAQIAAQGICEQLANVTRLESSDQSIDEAVLVSAVREVSNRTPTYARVYDRMGNDLVKQEKYDEAIEQFELSLAEEPENAATFNNLGIAYQRRGDEGDKANALRCFRQAIQWRSDFAEAHFNLAVALREENAEQAQQSIIRAIQLRPDFVAAHFVLSEWLLQDGRPRGAEAGFRQVIKLDSQHDRALRALANELARQQRFEEARNLFERYLALRPKDAEVLNNLGVVCSALNDRESAIQYLRAALATDSTHPRAGKNLQRLLQADPNTARESASPTEP